jgi:hypothetical protein
MGGESCFCPLVASLDVLRSFKPWINSTGAEQVKHHSGSYSAVVPGTSLRYALIRFPLYG